MAAVKNATNMKRFVNIVALRETCERIGVPFAGAADWGIDMQMMADGLVRVEWLVNNHSCPVPSCIVEELKLHGYFIKGGHDVWTITNHSGGEG